MPTLSFKLDFRSTEMNSLDLPVEVRKPNAALVTRTRSSQRVDLPTGLYYVSARLPAGQLITRPVEVRDAAAEVVLQPDPEDAWRHEWDEERHFLDAFQPAARARGPLDGISISSGSSAAWVREATWAKDVIGSDTVPPLEPRAYLRLFSGNLFRRERRIEPVANALVPQEYEAGRVAYFLVKTPAPSPVVAQLLQVGATALNMIVPQLARLAVSRRSEPTEQGNSLFKLEAFTKNSVANLLLRYGRQGAYQRAAEAAASERLLSAKIEDPVAAAVGAYSLLRTGELDRLHEWTANLDNDFRWLPDGAAIHGEHLARLGRHKEALAAFMNLPDRGLPFVADGLFYTVERLKVYARVPSERSQGVDAVLARKMLESLYRFTSVVHRQRPLTSFPGLDPVNPDFRRVEANQVLDRTLEVSWL